MMDGPDPSQHHVRSAATSPVPVPQNRMSHMRAKTANINGVATTPIDGSVRAAVQPIGNAL